LGCHEAGRDARPVNGRQYVVTTPTSSTREIGCAGSVSVWCVLLGRKVMGRVGYGAHVAQREDEARQEVQLARFRLDVLQRGEGLAANEGSGDEIPRAAHDELVVAERDPREAPPGEATE